MPKLLKRVTPDETKVTTGKTLKKAATRNEKAPLVKGVPDPRFPGFRLVRFDQAPDHSWFKKLNPRYNFSETFYRWDPKNKYVRCLVTVMPDGTYVAWDTCQYCHHYFTGCTCTAGIQTCRSVEYIHDAITARMAGETWGYGHPNYLGSLTRPDREARRLAPDRAISPARVVQVPLPDSDPSTGRTRPAKAIRRATMIQGAPRKLLKRSTSERLSEAVRTVDINAMDVAASEMIDVMSAKILQKGKTLKKATPEPKKLRKG